MNRLGPHSILATAFLLGAGSCDNPILDLDLEGEPPQGLPIDVTGEWLGTWTSSTGATGDFSGQLVQDVLIFGGGSPTPLNGTSAFEGFACFTPLAIEASVHPGGFTSPASIGGSFSDGSLAIEFFAGLGGEEFNKFSATYEVVAGSDCAGETGTLSASKVEPGPAGLPAVRLHVVVVVQDTGTVEIFTVASGSGHSPSTD